MSNHAQQAVTVPNALGVHLRAAGAVAQTAGKFQADIFIEGPNGNRANAKSIMSVLSLGAPQGTNLIVSAKGGDAVLAVKALVTLIENGFGLG